MPSYSLGEIMSRATAAIGRRDDLQPSDVSFYANIAYADVLMNTAPMLSERTAFSSTTSGTSSYTIPSDMAELISLRLTIFSSNTTPTTYRSYTTLDRMSIGHMDGRYSDGVGTPRYFTFFNNKIELYPSPDSVYSLQFRYRSLYTGDLTATSDIPSLTTPWRHAVYMRTKVLVQEHVKDYAGAAYDQAAYLAYVTQTKSDEAKRQAGEYRLHVAPIGY